MARDFEQRMDRHRLRAERLRREAGNCLGIAVSTRDMDTAAAMIDEATRLVGRAATLEAA
ncbi:hypothetical protein [Sphingomonas corticis]|jgi:hypothetical protein|uniref:Uncharacterized protein n=1 Tax=Sphingomonas corticis TaxID=2722791 RepID=A0ABX1CP97_9SPHN|nr:hypothetical protein [Sphingomonas corticis]NJR77552.1 hypothetical protein [Sphingomonas corticis]